MTECQGAASTGAANMIPVSAAGGKPATEHLPPFVESFSVQNPDPADTRLIFDVVEKFFTATKLFHSQFEMYESKVAAYAADRGLERTALRLNSNEIAGLFGRLAFDCPFEHPRCVCREIRSDGQRRVCLR